MSKKSRQGHLPRSKRKKGKSSSLAVADQRQAIAQTPEPVSHSGISTPSVKVPTSAPTSAVRQYPHISAEIRRIGVLAGITLSVLAVLAFVLS